MSDENLMSLKEFHSLVTSMLTALGDDAMVEVDVEFYTDEPQIAGKINVSSNGDGAGFAIKKIHNDRPYFRMHGQHVVRERLQEYVLAAQHVLAGLDGHPFTWSEGPRRAMSFKSLRMGATLITPSYAKQIGLQVIEGEQPVGQGAFDWGRKRPTYGSLYVMECQMEKAEEGGTDE